MTTIQETIEALKARNFYGIASAAKRGRNPEFPYVPVVKLTEADGSPRQSMAQTSQLKGLAYVTRQEAVDRAQRHIDRGFADLEAKLGMPHHRALREWHGLPREFSDLPEAADLALARINEGI